MCCDSSPTTAQAMAVPSYVAVPRPSSSTRTSECRVAWRRIVQVSLSSTKNVLSPEIWKNKLQVIFYSAATRPGRPAKLISRIVNWEQWTGSFLRRQVIVCLAWIDPSNLDRSIQRWAHLLWGHRASTRQEKKPLYFNRWRWPLPERILSCAPSLVNTLSTGVRRHFSAGT